MKSYIWIQTSDGTVQEVEQGIAMLCPYIAHEMSAGLGSSKTNPISLSSRVKPNSLSLIFDYCRFHGLPGRSNKVRLVFTFSCFRCLCHLLAFESVVKSLYVCVYR